MITDHDDDRPAPTTGGRERAARRTRAAVALAFAAAAGAGCSEHDSHAFAAITGDPAIRQAPAAKQLTQQIQHVFVIFKENHSYDNYFAA